MEMCSNHTIKEYLEDRFKENRDIDRHMNFKYFKQIIEGIKHVHRQGIIHRDLKPANVFITGYGAIKIGDFGLARAIDKKESKRLNTMATVIADISRKSTHIRKNKSVLRSKERSEMSQKVGTPLYLSPEQANGISYDEKVDIFSIGLILLELCYKFATNHEKIMGFADLRRGNIPQEVCDNMKYEAAILRKLTQEDPKLRPSAREITKLDEYKAWKQEMSLDDDD